MLRNALNLLKARNDPNAAHELAGKMIKDEVEGQTASMLFKFKLLYFAVLAIPLTFAGLGLYLGWKIHGVFYTLTALSIGVFWVIKKSKTAAEANLGKARSVAQKLTNKIPDAVDNNDES